jgi:anti-sigma regulatory factor (Ser/Thr protein kinase)
VAKSFFESGVAFGGDGPAAPARAFSQQPSTLTLTARPKGARIAVYDSLAVAPRVEEVVADGLGEAVEQLASRTYNLARERGGSIPYTVIREVAENLVHAGFEEVVVTILDDGAVVRFSDQGPGISDKERAFLPGFTTATAEMKRYIKGVGSGLPIVREGLGFAGGTVEIEDNLGRGAVVTLRAATRGPDRPAVDAPRLTHRQKQVLSLVVEMGSVGPSVVARELSVGLSTAYRDLAALEEAGLIEGDESGKRTLAEHGAACLEVIFG